MDGKISTSFDHLFPCLETYQIYELILVLVNRLIPLERNFPQMSMFFFEFTGKQQKTRALVVVGVNQNLEKFVVSRVICFSNKYFIQLLWNI